MENLDDQKSSKVKAVLLDGIWHEVYEFKTESVAMLSTYWNRASWKTNMGDMVVCDLKDIRAFKYERA